MTKAEQIMRVWLRFPEQWQHLWERCQRGEGHYTRGVFVFSKNHRARPQQRNVPQIMAEMLKSQPIGYLS